MNIFGVIVIIDMIMSMIVVIYTVNYLRLKEDQEEVCEDIEEEGHEYPELILDGDPIIRRRIVETHVFRDKDGVLHRNPPRYIIEVEPETPVDEDVIPMRRVTIKKVEPEIQFIGYVCDGGKRIIEA